MPTKIVMAVFYGFSTRTSCDAICTHIDRRVKSDYSPYRLNSSDVDECQLHFVVERNETQRISEQRRLYACRW